MSQQAEKPGITSEPFLQVQNLTKNFGTFTALNNISLDVYEGEFICFLGPSGCGKTTFLRAIAGLDIQTAGIITQAGKDISPLPPAERDFGIVFQSYALFPNLDVNHNVGYGLENSGKDKISVKQKVAELLDLVGLPDQGTKYPAQLSGGQQQRVALARALATSPGLLLLDEPLSALDAKVRTRLRHEIKSLQDKLAITTIMVTHDQEEALTMADRIVVMDHGTIEQVGTPQEIYRNPATLFVADFIGEMNKLKTTSLGNNSIKIGKLELSCQPHDHPNKEGTATIRPEDIIPLGAVDKKIQKGSNKPITLTVKQMEFLGSFWRTQLTGKELGGQNITADFSINAVRRISIEEGKKIKVELPENALRFYLADD
ncbi:MAG: putative 2-aminoethylphosphonate ABC transporter ATP-binding protein [Rhizobiaceae bacterium]|nr:putative 2-aminoethylphosphonate ABC transporter ATP-binding protein [Rhizobiaceae bacterium]